MPKKKNCCADYESVEAYISGSRNRKSISGKPRVAGNKANPAVSRNIGFGRAALAVAFGPVSKNSKGGLGEEGGIGESSREIMYEALGAIYLERDVPDRVDGVLYRKEGT